MADHVRKQLRDAVTTAVTGLTTTSTRVHGHRADPLQLSQLPALTVHVTGDEALPGTVHGPYLVERTVRLVVTGIAAVAANAETTIDDTLDTIGKEVETALGVTLTVSGKSVQPQYRGATMDEKSSGEKTVAIIEMEFDALLFTNSNAPDVLL